jgi:predicted dehydrogenase
MSTETAAPLRAAIIGPGYIGAIHAEAVRRCGAEIALIVGRPGSDLPGRAAALRAPRFSDRLEDALDDPAIDVVHVCTPNAFHFPMADAVLARGKHLVCEKPLAITAAEAARLARRAEAAGAVAGVAYCYRYYPLVRQMRALIARDAIGSLHHIRGLYLADELLHDAYLYYRFAPEIAGPSLAMADVGVHWCDLAEYVTGRRIVGVLAEAQTVVPTRQWRRDAPGAGPPPRGTVGDGASFPVPVDGEDCLSLLLRFEGGLRGALTVSQVSAGYKNWITLSADGATGGLDWNQEHPNTLTVRRYAPAWELVPKDPMLLEPEAAALAHVPGGHPEGYLDAFRNLISGIYAAIDRVRRGEAAGEEYPTLWDGWRGMAVLEAVLLSAREQRWVTVAGQPEEALDGSPDRVGE